MQTTPIAGIVYHTPPEGEVLYGLDGKVALRLGGVPVPLLEADQRALEGEPPGYDAVGRGIYHVLRCDPGCRHAERYAALLKEGYPHFVSELAGHVIMLGEKEVDVPYLERRVTYLRIFALMEPDNAQFPLEIGSSLLDMGVHFSALQRCTVTLFKAEEFLRRGLAMDPENLRALSQLAEVSYLLGRYDAAATLWRRTLPRLEEGAARVLEARLEKIAAGELPRVPAVDYLQAIAAALELKDQGGYEEAAAILNDVRADAYFCIEFPMPQIPYLLALCCLDMGGTRDARALLRQALSLNPNYAEAKSLLEKLTTGGGDGGVHSC